MHYLLIPQPLLTSEPPPSVSASLGFRMECLAYIFEKHVVAKNLRNIMLDSKYWFVWIIRKFSFFFNYMFLVRDLEDKSELTTAPPFTPDSIPFSKFPWFPPLFNACFRFHSMIYGMCSPSLVYILYYLVTKICNETRQNVVL
jgi:hypothetical protein